MDMMGVTVYGGNSGPPEEMQAPARGLSIDDPPQQQFSDKYGAPVESGHIMQHNDPLTDFNANEVWSGSQAAQASHVVPQAPQASHVVSQAPQASHVIQSSSAEQQVMMGQQSNELTLDHNSNAMEVISSGPTDWQPAAQQEFHQPQASYQTNSSHMVMQASQAPVSNVNFQPAAPAPVQASSGGMDGFRAINNGDGTVTYESTHDPVVTFDASKFEKQWCPTCEQDEEQLALKAKYLARGGKITQAY